MGPTLGQLIHLFILMVVNTLTTFALGVLLLRSLWALGSNTTTIETWEIERHATLVRRARVLGGYLEGPGGIRVYIKKQEYPYDIGIWANIRQGMGGSWNVSGGIHIFYIQTNASLGNKLVLAICCKS
jgi:palmitoyltransferase